MYESLDTFDSQKNIYKTTKKREKLTRDIQNLKFIKGKDAKL